MSDLDEELQNRMPGLGSSQGMVEQISYMIFGAAVTATRAFDKVVVKVEPEVNRIFVSITLRWWANFGRFKPLHAAWLHRAEKRCLEQTPTGWKLLIYYEGQKK